MSDRVGFSSGIKLHGNINRILEMTPHMEDNAISGYFKDEGITISPETVRAIRTEIVGEFANKAVSKKGVKKAIDAIKNDLQNQKDKGEDGLEFA